MDPTLAAIIGSLTLAIGIIVKLVGFPSQIRKNHQLRSTKGLSTTFVILSFVSYMLWTLHGIMQQDMVVWLGQGLGLITTGIILAQIFYYKHRDRDND